jgi:hypothetical protein
MEFFYGASQGQPTRCGAGAVLFIYVNHYYNILYMPSRGLNTKEELAAM